MTRRKQSNPRSVKAVLGGQVEIVDPESAHSSQECDQAEETNEQDYEDFSPLVVDTSTASYGGVDSPPPSENGHHKLIATSLPLSVTLPGSPPHTTVTATKPYVMPPVAGASDAAGELAPQSLSLLPSSASSPPSPGPSTPSSLASSSGLVESAASKQQRRGKKIMPVPGTDGKARWQCPVCNEELSSDHDLTVHIRSHNTAQSQNPNTCTICNKVLSSQSSLDRHMLVHSGERPFQCKVCKMTFTTNGNMHRHSRIHAKGELKTAMSQAEPQQIGTKASRSSSLVTPKSSRSSNLTRADGSPVNKGSTRSSWHKPQSYIHKEISASDNLLKNVTSGVDLHQALHGKLPQYQFLSSHPFTFVSQGHANTSGMPSLEHQDLKRIFLPEESASPPSPKKRKYNNGTDLKSGAERSIKNQDALQADSARFGIEGDTAVDLTMTDTAEEPGKKGNRLHSDDKTHHSPSRESASKANPQHHPHDQSLEEVHCPLCNKVLLSDFGLSSHLKAHHSAAEANNVVEESMEGDVHKAVEDSEGPSHSCSTCERAFSSSQKLVVHNRLTHSPRKLPSEFAVSLASSPVRPPQLNGLSKHLDAAVPGFYDLDFMEFTSEKFPLVAKVWCEKKPRRSSSVFHNFSCPECTCCFPNRGSLALHLASHKPDSWTSCPLCDCYFVSPDILHTHLSRHIADRAMSQALELRESDVCGKPESMEKTDFMAMLDLASTKDLNQSHRNESIIESISKEQNDEYFYKLIGMGVKKSAEGKSSNLGHSMGEKDTTVFKLLSCTDYARQNSPTSSAAVGEFPSKMQSPDLPPSMLSSEALMVSTPLFPGIGSSISAADSHPSSFSPVVPHGLQRVAGHGPFSLTPGCPNPYGSEEEDPLIDTKHNNVFACKYCGQAFSNYRALKGHTRVHLGLSPYKCNLCPYSSADKSTLIRHLRTHNGERPFQCLICDYAFTTKANCERHVRKKHEKVEKEEIEKAIAYNKYTTDLSTALENFHSPDTVCKYCGRDFKFFRALKHHLRSHSSCQQKPFMCTKCQVGFSMKANAIRHVQKQHEEVPQCDIEHYIHVNELAVISLEGNQTTEHDESVGSSSNVGSFTSPASSQKMAAGSMPPVAHSATPGPAEMLLSRALLRNQDFTQPLDFSLKHASMAARLSKLLSAQTKMEQTGIKLEDENQPIDLTTKKRTLSTSSCSSVTSPASDVTSSATHVKQAVPTPTSSRKGSPCSLEPQQSSKIVCPLCQKTFSVKEEASSHLCDVHQIPSPAYSDSLLSSDGNNNKTTSPHLAHFLPVVMPTLPLTSVMQAHAATASAGLTAHPAFGLVQQQKLAYRVPKSIHPSFMLPHLASIKKEPGTGSGSDSGCDLASVNKILDATDAHNFQAFLVPQATSSGSEDSDRHSANWESGDEESDRSLDQLYTQSLHSVTMKGDLVAEDGTDSKDGSLKKDEASGGKNEIQDQLEDSDESGTDNSLTMMSEVKDHEQKSTNNSPSSSDQLLVALSPKRAEEDSTPQKKKRNSYADSPHKLNCPHCPRSFPWVSSLKRHLLTHTGQKPFKCSRCPVTFSTKSNRERHLIRKHGVNMLDPASRQTMDRPYKCHLCVFSSFSTRSNLLKHYKERHPEHKPPEFYQDRLLDEDGFSETLSVKLNASSVDETSQSNTGSKAGSRAGELSPGTDGTSETAGVLTLQTPPKTKSMEAVIAALMRRETDSPGANYSASNFDENDEDSSDNTQTQSSDLPFSLSSSHGGSAERHVNPERDNYNVDKITHCWKCGDEFHSRKLLVRHLKEHNIDLPFKCYLCDASYDSRKECLLHQEKQHPSDWVVLKEKNGVDSLEEYADRLDLIVERNCKTGQFLEDGDDNDAGTLGTGVEDGQAEVMASDYLQRKVYCSLCPKRFWSLQDLRRHMRSHTGERPFECDKCGKRFTLKHSMMRHRRKHGNHDSPSALSDDDDSIQGDSSAGTMHRVIRPQHPNVAHHPAAVLQSENSCVPAADSEEEKHSDDGEDILHNLLGVESSTIDKIIDAKDSAASLLGV